MLAITAFGAIQGSMATHYRRIGPSIASHAFFNLFATLLILTTTT